MAAFSPYPTWILFTLGMLYLLRVTAAAATPSSLPDCAEQLTKDRTGVLQGKYPKLHAMIIDQNLTAGGNKHGQFFFLNAQDKVFTLKCPCQGTKEWKMHSNDSKETEEFNKKEYKNAEIRPRTPKASNYFRTYECKGTNGHHYFNVFTRPLPKTTFPVQWVEGLKTEPFDCKLGTQKKSDKNQDLYKFSWIITNSTDKIKSLDKVNFTPIADLSDKPKEERGFKFTLMEKTEQHKGKQDMKVKVAVVEPKASSAQLKDAGLYECEIMDENELSSSWRRDSSLNYKETDFKFDVGPKGRYSGFIHVHVRESWAVYVPIGVFLGCAVLFVIMIFVCPQGTTYQGEGGKKTEKGKGGQATDDKKVDLHPSETAAAATEEGKKKKKRRKKKKHGTDTEEESENTKTPSPNPKA